jgi:transmembrane sensor
MKDKTTTNKGTKGAVINFPDIKLIQTQAAEWMSVLDAENPSAQDLRGFKLWVNADPAHAAAFKEIISFWDDMNILTQAVLPREAIQNELEKTKASAKPTFSWLRHNPITAFASALLVMGTVVIITFLVQAPTVYTTQIGEQKTIQLSDSSIVQLNTNSRLEVNFTNNSRSLTLRQGEAHFAVAKNPQRPFEVTAGEGLVRAIGTAFTVHLRKIDVEVIVTEGTIEIDRADAPNQASINQPAITNVTVVPTSIPIETGVKIDAGNRLTYDRQQLNDIKLLVATQIEEQLSWREGLLVFKGEPLEKVVAEVSRYTKLKIIIPERSSREIKVGGLFKVGDTESLFEALRDGFDIHVQEVSDNVVYLISSKNR